MENKKDKILGILIIAAIFLYQIYSAFRLADGNGIGFLYSIQALYGYALLVIVFLYHIIPWKRKEIFLITSCIMLLMALAIHSIIFHDLREMGFTWIVVIAVLFKGIWDLKQQQRKKDSDLSLDQSSE